MGIFFVAIVDAAAAFIVAVVFRPLFLVPTFVVVVVVVVVFVTVVAAFFAVAAVFGKDATVFVFVLPLLSRSLPTIGIVQSLSESELEA
jgi:hypothetical protein